MNEFPRLRRQPPETLTRAIRVVLLTIVGLALLLGAALSVLARHNLFGHNHLSNHFALTQDLPAAVLIAAALLVASRLPNGDRSPLPDLSGSRILLIAAGAGLLGYAGTYFVLGNYPLSMDEFLATFDADILARGRLAAPIAAEWRDHAGALQPIFMLAMEGGGAWASSYLPGNAAIRATFSMLGDQALAGPVLAAWSLLLVHGIARKLEPDDRGFAAVAVLLLATSAQFLITAMTPYAMTAHLALNLAWLWLVLHQRAWALALALPVAFLATGLHQLVFHSLFAAPFLLYLWHSGRRPAACLLAAWTAACMLFWASYWSIALDVAQVAGGSRGFLDRVLAMIGSAFAPSAPVAMADNLLRLFTWQNPLLLILVAAALLALRRQPPIVHALLGGALLTLAALILLMPYQGHGWGYRYLHGFLGSFALVAAYGWRSLVGNRPELGPRLAALLFLSVAFSLAVLLPLRAWQAHAFTRPYAAAQAAIARSKADVVVVEHVGRYFSQDLVRNDPFLQGRPLVMQASKLRPEQVARLCSRYRVEVLSASSPELAGLIARRDPHREQASAARLARLRAAGCGTVR